MLVHMLIDLCKKRLSCALQLVDQAGIGKPTDYIPVAGPVTVSVNGTNTYVFMGLTLLVRNMMSTKQCSQTWSTLA